MTHDLSWPINGVIIRLHRLDPLIHGCDGGWAVRVIVGDSLDAYAMQPYSGLCPRAATHNFATAFIYAMDMLNEYREAGRLPENKRYIPLERVAMRYGWSGVSTPLRLDAQLRDGRVSGALLSGVRK